MVNSLIGGIRTSWRRPNGLITNDQALYYREWHDLVNKLEKLFEGHEPKCVVIGFDPMIQFGIGCASFSMPTTLAIAMLGNIKANHE